jgi:hypothetical protein
MSLEELANYIREHKDGTAFFYSTWDESVILQHVRRILFEHVHITDEHVFECCEAARNYDDFIERCRPIAKADTEAWLLEWNKPPTKGRTRRRFR